MTSKNTFSIHFWINYSRTTDNEAGLFVRITVNQQRTNISLKRKVKISSWDSSKNKAKGTSQYARQINEHIDMVQAKLTMIYQNFSFNDELITAKLMKAQFTGEGENHKTLNEIIEYHTDKMSSKFSKGTKKNYKITEGYIERFLSQKLKTTDIYLKQLDYKFLCDFENFLHSYYPKGHPKALGQNTVMKHIQRLRKLVTLAFHIEWIQKDPFVRWKPTYEKTYREFLNENELHNLETFYFESERLDRVRDLFVFSCYTGISYSDIMNLTHNHIHMGINGDRWIITSRQKTKTPVKIPVLDMTSRIIRKYTDHPITMISGKLLPNISNEKTNLYLKEVATHTGIKKNLTFHMARHTFATTVTLSNGVPIETVSKLLGHSKLTTTQIYAKVVEQKVNNDINNLREVLKKRRNELDDNNIKKSL